MKQELSGIIVPILTPLDAQENVDEARLRRQVDFVIEGNDKPGFKIDLHIKDLNNALDCAHSVGSPLPMTAAVQEIFQWLHNNGCGQDDHSSIIKYYKKLTGIESL